MKRLALLGGSGHGKVAAEAAQLSGWSEVVFFDDAWPGRKDNGIWPVIGDTKKLLGQLDDFQGVLVTIGSNPIRKTKMQMLASVGAPLVTIIHPSAQISRYCVLGIGSVVFAGAVINVDSIIGCGAIINTGATVDHDCQLGDYVHVSPGAHIAGGVSVGELSWVGIGASVRQMIAIGREVTVGAGAAVVKSVADGLTVCGVPARPLQQ